MRTIWLTLWLRKASVSAQMANETNVYPEKSWTVKTRNGGCSGWCGSAFLCFPCSSVTAFLLVSQTFALRLTTSRHLSLSCARYSRQLGTIPKGFMETFSVSLNCLFWRLWERLHWDSSLKSSFFGRRWSFMQTWPAQRSCDCIKIGVDAGKKKPELKLRCLWCVFAMWYRESSSDRSCESGLASF